MTVFRMLPIGRDRFCGPPQLLSRWVAGPVGRQATDVVLN
jgi:hypothetical protein